MLHSGRLLEKLKNRELIILDGATGTELQRRGVPTTLPLWSAAALMTQPQMVKQIHRDYLDAGAGIITTNTFRTTARILAKAGKRRLAGKLTKLAVRLAREARREAGKVNTAWVAGSIAPLEDCYRPDLFPGFNQAVSEFKKLAADLKAGGVDFLLLETMNNLKETRAALLAAQAVGAPIVVSFCLDQAGNLLNGDKLEEAVNLAGKFKVTAVTVNCMPIKTATKGLKKLRQLTTLPIGVYANGDGCPDDDQGWDFSRDLGVKRYLVEAKKWRKMGATILGGCCGTSPEYISQLAKTVV